MSAGGKKAVDDVLAADEKHLARIIVDSIREAEQCLEEEGPLRPEAFRAVDRAIVAAEKLNARIYRLHAELNARVAK